MMADMTLTKPAAGAQNIVNAQPDARLLFDFPAGDATLERSGDDLIFRFEDGSSLVLRDFYTSYTRENMPDFVIDGAPVSGEEFFAALNNEDLMPAAGPSNASNADGGRFREYADDPLQVGVDRLGGLDLGSGRAFYPERDPWGGLDDGSSPLPNREPIVNLVGGVGVIEAGVHPGGNDAYEGVPIVTGRVVATDDDGDLLAYGFIDASGQRVTTINTEYGTITIAPDGTFTYTLDNADPDTNGLALGETATETFTIFVDDGRGGFITQPVTVTITGTNDQPQLSITGSGQDVVEDGAQSVTGTFEVADPDSDAGRDQTFHIDSANGGNGTDGTRGENGTTDATFTTDYGTLILNPATGEWEYTLDNEGDPVQKLAEGETRTETFTVTVTDEHGATSQQTITVTITGTNDKPVIEKTDDLTLKESGVKPGGNDGTVSGDAVTPEGNEHKITATGKVDASDMDSDDDASSLDYKLQDANGNAADSIETGYGTVTIGKDGTYTYELKDGELNHLAQGETVTETITVMVTDSHGETVTKDITVTIYGTNDQPALDIKNAEQSIGEDTVASVGGDFTITDLDSDGANQTITIVGGKETSGTPTEGSRGENAFTDATFTTDYGKLTLNPETGKWTYEIDNDSDVVQQLGEGQAKTETFTVTVTDAHGATSQQTITVTITGTNDDPVVDGYTDTLTLKEEGVGPENGDPNAYVEGVRTATGTVEAHDVDANDPNLSYSLAAGENTSITSSTTDPDTGVQTIVTQYGTLVLTPGSLTADGKPSYTYTLDQGRADTLNAGQTHEENFTLTVTDGHGGTAEVPIHVTIEGTNDRPELKIDNAERDLTEDGDTSVVSGTFTVTDADADGAFGGQTDGTANQRYSIAGGTAGNGDVTTGTAVDSPDAGGSATFSTEYGTLTVNPDGTWTYELDNDSDALNALNDSETRTETFEVTVTDVHGANHTQTITVTITGTNDTPILTPVTQHVKDEGVFGEGEVSPNKPTDEYSGPDADGHIKDTEHRLGVEGQLQGSDAEGTELTYGVKTDGIVAGGTLTLTNPDNPAETTTIKVENVETANGTTTIKTEAGTFTINADGSYSFQLDATEGGFVDSMAQGEKWDLTFTATASDGKLTGEASLTICIEGTNDKPSLTLDNPTLEVVESGVGRDADGNIVDKGTPDQENATYEGQISAGGTAMGTDADNDASLTYGLGDKDGNPQYAENGTDKVTTAGQYGDLTLNADGSYTYVLRDEKLDSLYEGEKQSETFTIYVKDEHGAWTSQEVTVNITGTNDKPELTVTGSGQGVTEDVDGENTVTGTFEVADPDSDAGTDQRFTIESANGGTGTEGTRGENGTTDATFTTDYGKLILNPATGEWEYTLNNESEAVQKLGEGETKDETFTITVTDEHGATSTQTITVTITGTNDKPVINGADDLTLKESGVKPGGNDDTVSADAVTPEGNEHKLTATGKVDASDMDSDDDASSLDYKLQDADGKPADSIETGYGTVTIGKDGTYTYELKDGELNHLAQGETVTETITVIVTDSHGETVTKDITVTIYGTNDQPTLALDNPVLEVVESGVGRDADGNIVENGTPEQENTEYKGKLEAGGKATGADADDNAELTYGLSDGKGNPQYAENGTTSVTSVGQYGTLTLNEDGTYSYKLDDGKLDSLNEGEPRTETFTIYVKDEHDAWTSQELTVNITGTNDAPVLKIDNTKQEIEEDTPSVSGKFEVSDPDSDAGTNQTFTIEGGKDTSSKPDVEPTEGNTAKGTNATFTTEYGTLTLNPATGKWEYELNNKSDLVQQMKEGETKIETFTVTVTDEHGATDTETITVTIKGTNDAPVINGVDNLTLKESGVQPGGNDDTLPGENVTPEGNEHKLSATGKVDASDVDNDDKLTYYLKNADGEPVTSIKTQYGEVSINPETGEYTYTLNEDAANHLAQGQPEEDSFTVIVKDKIGATDEHKVDVNILGTNDKPDLTLSNKLLEVTEAGQTINDAGKQVNVGKDKDEGAATGDDADDGAHLTYTFIDADGNAVNQIKTDYGTLHIDSQSGKYWFQLDNGANATKQLTSESEPVILKDFTVRVTDEHGAYAEDKIDVKIQGSDDAPTMAGSSVSVKEFGVQKGGNTPLSDYSNKSNVQTIKVTDQDGDTEFTFAITNEGASEVDGNGIQNLVTDYGTYFLNTKTGEYWFELDNNSEKVNQLNEGETVDAYKDGQLKLKVSVTSDRDSLSSENWFQVKITGTNDRPDLTLLSKDPGTADGWSIVADQDGNATITMKEGDTVEGTVKVTDPDEGGKQGETFTFAVDKGEKGSDLLNNNDLKAAEANKGMVDGKYGTLTVNPDGSYTYTAHENLAEDHLYEETFTIFVKDKLGAWDAQTVTVKVTGSADAPVIKGTLPNANVIEYTEAGVIFNKNDDKADSIDGPGAHEAGDGSFILGTFEAQQTDTANGAGQLIAGFVVGGKFYANELQTEYGTLKITIENGKATYSFLPPAEGTDQAKALDSLTEADRIKLFDELGGLKVGVYDSAHEKLVQQDTGKDERGDYFTIADGKLIPTQDVDFYIHGTNDRPYFIVDGEKLEPNGTITIKGLVEDREGMDDPQTITGTLNADDPDSNHNPGDLSFSIVLGDKLVQVAEGKYGILELHEDGTYTYTLTHPERLQSLNEGQSLIDSALEDEVFDIRVTDPDNAFTDGKLTIDVTGTEDKPTITAGTLEVWEDKGQNDTVLTGDDVPTCTGKFGLTDIVDAQDFPAQGGENVTWSNVTDNAGGDVYGTLEVNPDGTYTYKLTENGEKVIQELNVGDKLEQTFTIKAEIEGGNTVTKDITITIHGTNDKPVIVTNLAKFEGEVTRDVFDDNNPTDMGDGAKTGVIFKGELKGGATDVDNPDEQLKYMLVDENGQPVTELKTEFGTITLTHTLNNDGSISTSYTYTLDNESPALIEALKKNPNDLFDPVEIVAVDPHGAVSDEKGTINIKINPGQDDGTGPGDFVINPETSDLTASVTEDGDDPTTPTIEDFTAHGKLDAIWGPNSGEHAGKDAPDHVFGIKGENGQQVQGDVAADGKYGYLVINPATGEYTYTLYNGENGVSNPVQDLAQGEVVEETFEIMLNGKPTGEKLTITIHGTNDAPTIKGVEQTSNHTITEDAKNGWEGSLPVTGRVEGLDIDRPFEKDENGNYKLDADGKPIYGEQETVTYKFEDNAGKIESTYDENGNLTSQTLTIEGMGTVVLNTVTGEYSFTMSPDFKKHLVAGAEEEIKFGIVAVDPHGATSKPADITIKLEGVNRAPEVTQDTIQVNVTEDAIEGETTGGLIQKGDLNDFVTDDKDPDGKGDNLTFDVDGKTVVQGEYGTLVINKDGTYTYTLNNADDKVQGLDAKNPGEESFTITVRDSDGGTAEIKVNVTVTGKDDVPQVTVGEVIKAVEGSDESYTGKVTAVDKDAADKEPGALKYTFDEKNLTDHPEWTLSEDHTMLTTEYGTYKIGPDGSYTFTLNNDSDAVRKLAAGTLSEQTVTVVVTDTHGNSVTQEVTVNISGQNTGPDFMDGDGNRIKPDAEGKVTVEANAADAPLEELPGSDDAEFTGQLDITDPDEGGSVKGITSVDGQPVSGPTTVEGKYGTLTINSNGSYTYTYTSDALGKDETDSDSFTIVATDNYGATTEAQLVVNLKGTNDDPVITSDAPVFIVVEPAAGDMPRVDGTLTFTDADLSDNKHTATVKKAGEAGEGGNTAEGTYGKLVIDSVNHETNEVTYHYELTSKALGKGENATETFIITVDDGNGGTVPQTITVNVRGTNDAPVIETANAPTGDIEGSFSFSDADVNDTHSLSVLIGDTKHKVDFNAGSNEGTCEVAGVGTFAFTPAGEKNWTYTFTPDTALTDTLRPDESYTVDFQIQVSDGDASVPSGDLSVTFQGTNEAPQMTAAADGAAGTLSVTDGDLQFLAVLDKDGNEIAKLDPESAAPQDVTIDGHTVTFTRQADGSYKYELDGGKAHMGEKAEVSFSIQATDALGSVGTGSLTLVAEGTQNAAPTANGGVENLELVSRLLPENINPDAEAPAVTGQLTDSDPDGDSLTYSAGTLTGSHGSLVLNADGSYTYTLDMSEAHLVELVMQRGEALTETFTYTVNDEHGGTSEGSITITVNVPDDFSTGAYRGAASFASDAGNDDAAHAAAGDDLHDTDGLGHQPDDGNALAAHAGGNTLGTDGTDGTDGSNGINGTDGTNVPGTPDGDGGDTPLNADHLAQQGMGSTLGTEDLNGLSGHGTDGLTHTDDNASDAASLAAHGSTNGSDAGNGAFDAAHGTLSGDGSGDQLLGASPFTADDFGDQDIFGSATHEVFSAPAQSEGFYADMGGLAEAGQLLEAPDNSLDGVLAPSEAKPEGTDDLGLTSLQPGDDLGGGSMPGLVPTETMPDSPDIALAAGAAIPGAEDNLAHQQAMHEVNHSNG